MTDIIHGDTFDQIAPISDAFPNGSFTTGVTITSQIRTAKYGNFISDLVCSWIDPQTTKFLRLFYLDTSAWPLGDASVDVQFVRDSDGYTFSSVSLPFTIVKDITSSEST